MQASKQFSGVFLFAMLSLAIIATIFAGEAMAKKNKGEDIILYNGNIVLRGKGKKGGSIVLANSPSSSMEMMPFMMPYFGR